MEPPSTIPVKLCPACKTPFKTIFYQRRAADEPPDEVTYCEKCPLDTNKLNIKNKFTDSETNTISNNQKNYRRQSSLESFSKLKLSSCIISNLEFVKYKYRIEVKGKAALRCYNLLKDQNVKFQSVIVKTMAQVIEGSKKIVSLNTNCKLKQQAHVIVDTFKIAPFINLSKVSIHKERNDMISNKNLTVIGYEYELTEITQCEYSIIRFQHDGRQPCIYIYLKDNEEDYLLQSKNILQQVLNNYGTETSIKSFTNSELINSMYIQSSRAIDSDPFDAGYSYTWKPDGERFWCVKYGSVWLFCRRLLSAKIVGWRLTENIETTTSIGPVLDIEVLISHKPILIDILVLANGNKSNESRCLEDVLQIYNSIKTSTIPIHVRRYYDTIVQLKQSQNKLTYPIDGIVGIENKSMNIIKVKDIKAIELKLCDDGTLVTSEGTVIANSNLLNRYDSGSIIEIRFSVNTDSNLPEIVETLLRTDKIKANDYNACKDIMSKASLVPDSLARRNAVQWCNSVRRRLYNIASNSVGRGRIILDIGSGDGQAISDYDDNSELSYLLIEPDEKKCIKMVNRLSLSKSNKSKYTVYNTSSLIFKAIKLLTTKSIKYAIMCCKIEDIMKEKDIIRTMKTSIRCCIASYSISHTSDQLVNLVLNSIPVIGCGYMYDSVNSKGVLVDSSGVYMGIKKDDIAEVKWGNDKVYTENAITKQSFNNVFYMKLASEVNPIKTGTTITLLDQLSQCLYVISSDRYTF